MIFGQIVPGKTRRENQCNRFGDFYYSAGKYRDLLTENRPSQNTEPNLSEMPPR
jgi:hypothetical protein